MSDVVSIGSRVGEGARLGPGVGVQVVLPCSRSCQSSDSVSIIVSILALCFNMGSDPCLCVCRSGALRLQK
jgi:hypothetical protein